MRTVERQLTVEAIETKQVTVGVVGLGYVGLPLSLGFAESGLNVVGFDTDTSKVEQLRKGESYLQYIPAQRVSGARERLAPTTEFRAISDCQAVIICVPTPLDPHLDPDLTYVRQTCHAIAPHIQPGTLVALESTTYPGTTAEVVQTILEEETGLEVGKELFLCFSPEREDPGNPTYNTRNIPKLVGADDHKSLELAVALYRWAVNEVVPLRSTRVAESAKLLENIFRSVNIALVNELKTIFDKMKINVWDVIEAAGSKPFGYMPFWPGPGLGGHCIPIDPFYLTWKAKEYGVNTRFIELAGEINRAMPVYVVGKIQDCLNDFERPLRGSRILVLGLAYKPNVADLRESPSLELIRLLEEKGAVVDYCDPYINEIPTTREYATLKGKRSQKATADYHCLVLATGHQQFIPEELLGLGVPVVDTRNLFPRHELVYRA